MGPNQAASDSAVRGLTRFLASNYEVNDTAVTLHTAEAKGCEQTQVVEKAFAKAVVTKQAQPANSASQICKTLTSLIGHFFVRNYSVKYNIGIFCEAA